MLIIYLALCSLPHLALLFPCPSLELSKQTLQHITKTLPPCSSQEQAPTCHCITSIPKLGVALIAKCGGISSITA
jgi:hypothetical protein